MNLKNIRVLMLGALLGLGQAVAAQQKSPNLILTQKGVQDIKAQLGKLPMLDKAVNEYKESVQGRLTQPVNVPLPKDAGGGYTHETHKENYRTMYEAGVLYHLTGDTRYADYTKNYLLKYADMYPKLGLHPAKKEQAPGKLFWQSLNDCVWLVYTSQAYDAVKPYLNAKDQKKIEQNLLLPAAKFLSEGSAETFDKIHNHGTWAVAAVGMTGYVINNKHLVEQALLGLKKDGKGGFLAQLDQLFSPQGYYTEGPYYQRYAIMPFAVFAQAIENNEPQRKIFEHRDGILLKAINTGVELTYNGHFFPINDALKEKNLKSTELLYSVNIAYAKTGNNQLLDIAKYQDNVIVSAEGVAVAKALHENKAQSFSFKSMEVGDGAQGKEGALGVIRSGHEPGHQALLMKYTSQGMGHGHYDKLTWMFYDNGQEIIQDYGAARFLNIEAKYGGHYLPENKTWAKQTIAHNTVVVDEQSHFKGSYERSMTRHPEARYFNAQDPNLQVMSAEIGEVYDGVKFTRTMAMVKDPAFGQPIILDVFEVESAKQHQYDLPLYFQGHVIGTTHLEMQNNTTALKPLGAKNGYEHLWHLGTGKSKNGLAQTTWLNGNRFYTYTTMAGPNTEVLFTKIGANDPNFNLRNEPGLIVREKGVGNHTFVSVLEPHGVFNATQEFTRNAASNIKNLRVEGQGKDKVIIIETQNGAVRAFALSNDTGTAAAHHVTSQAQTQPLNWQGPYHYFKLKN